MESRRSATNLSYLTLAPLTTRLPLDDDEAAGADLPEPWTTRTSYIAGKSAPTTPRILSRNTSQTRLGQSSSSKLATSKSYTYLAYAEQNALSKSKSTSVITPHQGPIGPQGRKPYKKVKSASRLAITNDHGEWLYRAGAAITSEMRESKGQSWLVSRESSTSLAPQAGDDDYLGSLEDNELERSVSLSPKISRTPSRVMSTRTSRRGSKVGSRADLTYFATPAGERTPGIEKGSLEMADYFGAVRDANAYIGPDFVDVEDEEEDDGLVDDEEEKREEDEVAKLARDRGFGLGSIVDRFMGWTLFDVQEDGRESENDSDSATETPSQRNQGTPRQQPAPPRHKLPGGSQNSAGDPEAQGGWADAAWLLSVASKVIL